MKVNPPGGHLHLWLINRRHYACDLIGQWDKGWNVHILSEQQFMSHEVVQPFSFPSSMGVVCPRMQLLLRPGSYTGKDVRNKERHPEPR